MAATTPMAPTRTTAKRTRPPIVDCDIHNAVWPGALDAYLPKRWRRHGALFGSRTHQGSLYPKGSPAAARHDAWPPSGRPAGGDLDFMRQQLLDAEGISYGILNCLSAAGTQLNADYSAALSRAVNEWQIVEWLDKEPRLRAGVAIPYEDADLAVTEIDRFADHPGFVQVLLVARSAEPLGRRKYWKIYEAAERHGLPVGIHFGGGTRGVPVTASGWPSYYIEDHTDMAQAFQAHVVSLVCEGVFERFPRLRVVLIEGGFAWLPPLMWRLDKHWRRLKEEVPHLKRAPSEYIRDHMWVTTQPIEEPHDPRHILQVFDHLGGTDRVMFSTDYPHWDYDDPDRAFRVRLPEEDRQKIFAGNAKALYGLA
ncbi:amidohydrolase family protein [Actinopolymorpha sp. B9G3]|uniref:amidohydrolase family protein n=1 Tax=Actinopolymorpha sp. B9G3 TaxID=3158970 RepID=UPI0032D95D8A